VPWCWCLAKAVKCSPGYPFNLRIYSDIGICCDIIIYMLRKRQVSVVVGNVTLVSQRCSLSWSFFRLETPNNVDEIQHRACFLHVFSNCLSGLLHTLLILISVVDTDEEREYTSGRYMNDELMIIGLLLSSENFNASIYLLVRLSCLILLRSTEVTPRFSMLLYISYVYKYLIVFDTCVVLQRQLIAPICTHISVLTFG